MSHTFLIDSNYLHPRTIQNLGSTTRILNTSEFEKTTNKISGKSYVVLNEQSFMSITTPNSPNHFVEHCQGAAQTGLTEQPMQPRRQPSEELEAWTVAHRSVEVAEVLLDLLTKEATRVCNLVYGVMLSLEHYQDLVIDKRRYHFSCSPTQK